MGGTKSETPVVEWRPYCTVEARQGDDSDSSEIQVEMDDAGNLRWSTPARRPEDDMEHLWN